MMYTEDKIALGVFGVIILLFVGFLVALFFAVKNDERELARMYAQCEAADGALLDHTRQVGKSTYHDYVCVDKNVIVNYGNNK